MPLGHVDLWLEHHVQCNLDQNHGLYSLNNFHSVKIGTRIIEGHNKAIQEISNTGTIECNKLPLNELKICIYGVAVHRG